MSRTLLIVATLAVDVLLVACPSPKPAPTPPPDASDSGPADCMAACAQLHSLGCAEGAASDCAASLGTVERLRLVRTPSGAPLSCAAVARATSVAEARGLGIACLPVSQ